VTHTRDTYMAQKAREHRARRRAQLEQETAAAAVEQTA
jgi:hypothetical protein